jgi:hypothetical protein
LPFRFQPDAILGIVELGSIVNNSLGNLVL